MTNMACFSRCAGGNEVNYTEVTFSILIWLALLNVGRAQNPRISGTGRQLAEQTVLASIPESHQTRAHVTRREDLEQDVVELQYLVKYSDGKPETARSLHCVEIYEVTRSGIEAENGAIVSIAVNVDDVPIWLVAYDCETKSAFHLAGFIDDEDGMNRFVKALDLGSIDKENKALFLFSTFLRLSSPDLETSVVRDELGLMSATLSYFRSLRSSTADGFHAFWNQCPKSARASIANPVFSPSANGFLVTFFTYSEGTIRKNVVLISRDGRVSQTQSKILFVWPSQSAPNPEQD